MRSSQSHVGRFVLALLATVALVLLISQAQGQSSRLPETLDARDAALRSALRTALSLTNAPCLFDPVEGSIAMWCGDISADASASGVFPLMVTLIEMTALANDLALLRAEDRSPLPSGGELYMSVVGTPDYSRAYLVSAVRHGSRAHLIVERLGVEVGHGN